MHHADPRRNLTRAPLRPVYFKPSTLAVAVAVAAFAYLVGALAVAVF